MRICKGIATLALAKGDAAQRLTLSTWRTATIASSDCFLYCSQDDKWRPLVPAPWPAQPASARVPAEMADSSSFCRYEISPSRSARRSCVRRRVSQSLRAEEAGGPRRMAARSWPKRAL